MAIYLIKFRPLIFWICLSLSLVFGINSIGPKACRRDPALRIWDLEFEIWNLPRSHPTPPRDLVWGDIISLADTKEVSHGSDHQQDATLAEAG